VTLRSRQTFIGFTTEIETETVAQVRIVAELTVRVLSARIMWYVKYVYSLLWNTVCMPDRFSFSVNTFT